MTVSLDKAIRALDRAGHAVAFTGAGISVESGIPPFRGENGLWSRYDPHVLDLDYFYRQPEKSWKVITDIFYRFFGTASPNAAHYALAEMQKHNRLQSIITQNIDNLHQQAGSSDVIEFHGNSQRLRCRQCQKAFAPQDIDLGAGPWCPDCSGLLKPDFIFFGEQIPPQAYERSFQEAERCDVLLVVGSTGEVMPAALVPQIARDRGAVIIECNIEPSGFTRTVSDIFLRGKASDSLVALARGLDIPVPFAAEK